MIIINYYWLRLSPTGLVIYLNHHFRSYYEDSFIVQYTVLLLLKTINHKFCRLQICLAISGSSEREFVVTVLYKKKKKHECCYNVDFTRGRKALCDTRCNTFLRSVLLCAYTDYYDHCDYYDDGNFFHNSPLLHSLVSTMQLWCYIINTIVWLSPFFFVPVLRWYTFTRTHRYTHMQKTPQINAIVSKQSICTTLTALMFNTFTSKAFLFLLLLDAF